jgi:hypothetical protein
LNRSAVGCANLFFNVDSLLLLQHRIVLFSHWAVLRALTGKNFENCESSEYGMEDLADDVICED